jgi:quercetin dioxygenase-like cupin family protein
MKDITTGTDTREARSMQPAVMGFDLLAEAERLRAEPAWAEHGRSAKTLAKAPAFRVVLSLLRAGGEVGDDDAWSPIAVQVLAGAATAGRGADAVELEAGGMAWIDEGAGWTVHAREDAVLLISMTWPAARAEGEGDDRYDAPERS